jgi:E3 ubiquitin-protein ligase EDD1
VLYTAVRMECGNVFWWGILPFQQRKRLLEKYTNKKKMLDKFGNGSGSLSAAVGAASRAATAAARVTAARRARSGIAGISLTTSSSAVRSEAAAAVSDITLGSQVCMRNAPMYQAGSIGFTVAGGVPKVGQLLSAAWNIDDTCRFMIIQPPKRPKLPELPRGEKDKAKEDNDTASMPPPPSPASSTCSDGSISSPAAVVSVAGVGGGGGGGGGDGRGAGGGGGGRRQKRSAPKEEPEKVCKINFSRHLFEFYEEWHRVLETQP